MKKYTISLLLLITLIVVAPASASAQTNTGPTPGSFWYGITTTFENVNLFFTFNSEKKAEKALGYAEKRLAQVEAAAESENPEALETALANYETKINLASESSKKIKDSERAEKLLTLIADNTSKHQEVLSVVLENVPEEAREAIMRAIEVSKKERDEAMQKIAELKGDVEKLKEEVEDLRAKDEERQKVIDELNKQREGSVPKTIQTPTPSQPTTTPETASGTVPATPAEPKPRTSEPVEPATPATPIQPITPTPPPSPPSTSVPNDTIGHWKFDEGEGKVAYDSSGNNNSGTLSTERWVEGKFGHALSFNGTGGIDVGDRATLDGFTNLTISLWIKATDNQVGVLVNKYENLANNGYYLAVGNRFSPSEQITFMVDESSEDRIVSNQNITNGQWHHIVAVYAGGNGSKLYIDGKEQSVSRDGKTLDRVGTAPGRSFKIGTYSPGGYSNFNFKGTMDDVRIYNRVLSSSEIKSLYEQ